MTQATRDPLPSAPGSASPPPSAPSPSSSPSLSPSPRRMLREPSPLALQLGYGGLLPFVLGAALLWIVRPDAHPYVALGLSAYAAVIVSFLGGIHWGFAFRQMQPDPALLIWGVVPSLVAWVAVVMPPYSGLVLHGAMLIVCYVRDRSVYPAQGAAGWLTLRFRLSGVAALCCFVGAAGS